MKNAIKAIGIKPLYKYGYDVNYYDVAKFIAIIFMIVDHIGFFFLPEMAVFRGAGRIAFPVFFFLIGYSNYYRFSPNLLIIGIILSVYKALVLGLYFPFDVLISAFLVREIMRFLTKTRLIYGFALIPLLIVIFFMHIFSTSIFAYGGIGLLFAICGHYRRLEIDSGKTNKVFPALIIITLIGNLIFEFTMLGDQNTLKPLLSIESALIGFYFLKFPTYKFNLKNDFARNIILFFSRNSLFIYWLHFAIFITLTALLFPARFL